MAKYEGTVPVTGTITPVDTNDIYPIVGAEHIKGGYRPVATKADLANIPTSHLVPGSLALVVDEKKFYYYNPELDNQWPMLEMGSGGPAGIDQAAVQALLDDYYNKLEIDKKLEAIPIIDPLTVANKDEIPVPDNDTVYIQDGKLKANQSLPDGNTIENVDGRLSIASNITDEIARIANKVDKGLTTDADGKVIVKTATPIATGVVRPDNRTIVVDDQGVISTVADRTPASIKTLGLVKPDGVTVQTTSDGTLSLVTPIENVSDLKDVHIDTISGKMGYALCVNEQETGFTLRQVMRPMNKTEEYEVNSPDKFKLVKDFQIHFNIAVFGIVKAWGIGDEFVIKWVSNTGGSIEEDLGTSSTVRHIPNDELDVKLYAKGTGKVSVNIASYI